MRIPKWVERSKTNLVISALSIALFDLVPVVAIADPIDYQFIGTISGGTYGPNPVPLTGNAFLRVTDSAIAAGQLDFQVAGICPGGALEDLCTITGNPDGFSAFGYYIPDFSGDPPAGEGRLNIDVAFNPDGTLSGGIFDQGNNADFNISGSEFDWSGSFSSDASLCDTSIGEGCTISGYWFGIPSNQVPGPPSLWLFSAGLLMLLLLRTLFVRREGLIPATARGLGIRLTRVARMVTDLPAAARH